MIWCTLTFNPDDMRYSCSGVAFLQRYYQGEKKLSIFRDCSERLLRCEEKLQISFIQGNLVLEVRRTVPIRFSNKQSCQGSGSRDSKNGAFSIFEKAILLGV
ncbi:hypothetical protein ACFX2F_003291 [Malus domestica]